MQPEPSSPASPSVWPPLPPSIFVADVVPLLKEQPLHSFHVTYKLDLQKEKNICVFIYIYVFHTHTYIYTYIYIYFPPYAIVPLGIGFKASYLHLCKANPGHWSPQALHGWPLSIRPSPVNFKTKRQHAHVSTSGTPSKAPLVSQAGPPVPPTPPHLI